VLGDGEDRRDGVGWVRVFGSQKRVVQVQLAYGDAGWPSWPTRVRRVYERVARTPWRRRRWGARRLARGRWPRADGLVTPPPPQRCR
jgi:hypothetical protein